VGTVQRALDINSLQLMLKQMPLSAAILLPVIVLAEDITSGPQPLVALQVTPQLIGVVVLTACMAFFVNVSTFYIIAELSPIRSPPPFAPKRYVRFISAQHSRAAAATTCSATARPVLSSSGERSYSARYSPLPPPSSPFPPHAPCRASTCRRPAALAAALPALSGTRVSAKSRRRSRWTRLTNVTALCCIGGKTRASSLLRRAVHWFTRAVLRQEGRARVTAACTCCSSPLSPLGSATATWRRTPSSPPPR
jgi:hypothetical protein